MASLNLKSRNKLGDNALKFAQDNLSVTAKVDEILECVKV
jgi:hypothetical protein